MKLFKISSTTLALVVSLTATEIQPFGGFNFGDSFTPVYEQLCKTENITDIKIGFEKPVTKSEFCKSKQHAVELIAKSSKPKFGPGHLDHVTIKGFENIARYNLYIRADGINVKGVDFQLQLHLGTFREEETVGSYLLTKDDAIKIDKYYVPLELDEVQLKPKKYSEFTLHQEAIFDILWKKYGHLVKKDNQERQKNGHYIDARGKDGTALSFGGSDGIVYRGSLYINKLRDIEFKKSINNSEQNQNDSSSDL